MNALNAALNERALRKRYNAVNFGDLQSMIHVKLETAIVNVFSRRLQHNLTDGRHELTVYSSRSRTVGPDIDSVISKCSGVNGYSLCTSC